MGDELKLRMTVEGQARLDKSLRDTESGLKNINKALGINASQFKASGQTLNQFSNILNQIGGSSVAGLLNQVEGTVGAVRQMNAELGKSNLAMLAIGAAAASLGTSVGVAAGTLLNERDEKQRSEQIEFLEILKASQDERLGLLSKEALQQVQINRLLDERAQKLMGMKNISLNQFIQGANEINALREANRLKIVGDRDAEILDERRKANDSYYQAQDLIAQYNADQDKKRLEDKLAGIDKEIEALERLRVKKQEDALAADQLSNTMRINSLKGDEQIRASQYAAYESRLREISALEITEEQAIRMSAEAYREYKAQQAILEQQVNERRYNATYNMLGDIATASKMFGKKGLAAYKAFASAQALMDTYKGAGAAFAALAGIPYVGPFLGAAAAAAAVAAGIARVAQINSAGSAGGYMSGGYTGDIPVNSVAGYVHGQEYVVNAEDTRRVGIDNIERFIDTGAGAESGATVVNGGGTSISVGLINSLAEKRAWLRSDPEVRKILIDMFTGAKMEMGIA